MRFNANPAFELKTIKQGLTVLKTIAPSREVKRAARPTVLGTRTLGKLALSMGLIGSVTGCQLGMRQPLNLPPGLGSPHSSSFKPDTGKPDRGQADQAQATDASSAARIRGQSPDAFRNGTLGTSDPNRRPMQPTVTQQPPANNRYTGPSTLGPNNRAPSNAPNTTSKNNGTPNSGAPSYSNVPPKNNSPFTLPVAQTQAQTQMGLVSDPAGPQQQLYAAPQGYPAQPNAPQQTALQPPTGNNYQQPVFQQQPVPQQPGMQQPTVFDPYATAQGNTVYNQGNLGGAAAPQANVPNTYQMPGQPYAGQNAAGQYGAGQYGYDATIAPGAAGYPSSPENALAPGAFPNPNDPNSVIATQPFTPYQPRERIAPLDVYLQEARTGRVMIGGSVNSDLGLSGQLTIDERNFDITKVPTSWDDVWSGRAFRGRGQNFRAELMPGTRVQRYTVNWSERNFLDTPYSLSVGGFLYTRQFRDWTEQRLGGRVAVGYEITKDLSISTELRMEDVKIFNPRKLGVSQLDRALGSNDLYTGRIRLAHDTRDSPFMSSEGHLLEMIYDQVFGEFDYPRGLINYNRYFLVRERPDQTGRHTLASTWKLGFSGKDTPIFENFYAGGYSTLRGFRFRGASPMVNDVQVGGRFMFLGSLEYVFPLTADEMLRGVAFCDYGTIEQDFTIKGKNIRVAPGLGLRVAIPALGPAPLAFDFAYPVQKADGDQTQVFSFFMGFTR